VVYHTKIAGWGKQGEQGELGRQGEKITFFLQLTPQSNLGGVLVYPLQ